VKRVLQHKPEKQKPVLQEIIHEIAKCDKGIADLESHRMNLVHSLKSLESKAAGVMNRFRAGDYIINSSGRHFWANDGNLLRAVYREELDGLEELMKMQLIARD